MPPKGNKQQPPADEVDEDFVPEGVDLQQLMASGNPALIAAMQQGLSRLVGQSSGYLESLPAPVRTRLAFLEDLQGKYDEVEEEFEEELKALEEKYKKLYEPLLEQRRAIVTGEAEAPDNETEEGRAAFPGGEEVPAGIPDFWLVALRNHPDLEELITEKDTEVLAFLTDVSSDDVVDEDGDEAGFKLKFTFSENPFFTDKALTVTYLINQDSEYMSVRGIEGCKVHWNPDKDVTVKKMKKKPKPGSKAKALTKLEPVESFFRFFAEPPQVPEQDDDEAEDEEMEALHEAVEHHVGIGEVIRERIIPHAVEWFTGAALEEMDGEESDEDDEEEGDEGEGDDDEDDEDDDSDDDAEPGAAPTAGKEQECKQQ